MRSMWKRIMAVILCTAMIVTMLPQGSFGRASAASLLENTPEYNQEILDALSGIVGSEDAEEYYRRLQQYGLIDENGNVLDNWDIELDGKKVTIDEIREILAGDYDPKQVVWVDGTPVYMSDLKTMIEIEEYLAYIKETYFSDKVWSEDQKATYYCLLDQLRNEGIELISNANNPISGTVIGASGISHEARVSVTLDTSSVPTTVETDFDAVFNVNLTGAVEGQAVTFKYRALSASRTVADSGVEKTVTLTAGDEGTATGSFTIAVNAADPMADTDPLYSTESYFYVNCHGITNALFTRRDTSNNDVDCESLGLEVKCKGSTDVMPECMNFDVEGDTGIPDSAKFHSRTKER